jgi:glycosyltransferase involved in cell wall biosynthesis
MTLALLIPAWNAARWLPRLLASAAAQTEPFDEIWVYDDASTDDTAAIAEGMGARVIRGQINLGCSAGKNALACRTSCEWIHFHDADDELMPNFVALAQRWMARGTADVVLFPYEERDETGAAITVRRFDPDDLGRDARSYAIREQINPFCGLYRRQTFLDAGGYDTDPAVLYNEDVAMHIGLAFAGLAFAAETDVSIINHRRGGSMSAANARGCARAQLAVLEKTAARPGAEAYATEIAGRLWPLAAGLAYHREWPSADRAQALARRLAGVRAAGSLGYRSIAALSPALALRVREAMVRLLKPQLRAGISKAPPP